MASLPPRYRNPTSQELAVTRRVLEVGIPLEIAGHAVGPTDRSEKAAMIERAMAHMASAKVTFDCSCGCPSISVEGWEELANAHCIAQAYGRSAFGPMLIAVFGNGQRVASVGITPFASDEYELALPSPSSVTSDLDEVGQWWPPPPENWQPQKREAA